MNYKIADVVWKIIPQFDLTEQQLANYRTDEKEQEVIAVDKADIDREKDVEDGFADWNYESVAIFRKISGILLEKYQGIIFHSSCVMVGDRVYAFTAPSGTGKSTHARMWREAFGEDVVMVNDDKPLIKKTDDGFYVYGTPWMGKHSLGANVKGKLYAVCKIERALENSVEKLSPPQALITVLNQTVRPNDAKLMNNLLNIVDEMLRSVAVCKIKCTPTVESAIVARSALEKEICI